MSKRCCECGRELKESKAIGIIGDRLYCDKHNSRYMSWIPIGSGKAEEILNAPE